MLFQLFAKIIIIFLREWFIQKFTFQLLVSESPE